MMLKSTSSFRKTAAGLCLIIAPLLESYHLIQTHEHSFNGESWLHAATHDPNYFVTSALLTILAGILYIPAFFGLIHLLREKAPVLANISSFLILFGIFGFVWKPQVDLLVHQMQADALDSGQMALFLDQIMNSYLFPLMLGMFTLGLWGGLILLTIGLWRSLVVPRGALVLLLLFIVCGASRLTHHYELLFLCAGLIWMGLTVLRMPLTQWNHPSRRERVWY